MQPAHPARHCAGVQGSGVVMVTTRHFSSSFLFFFTMALSIDGFEDSTYGYIRLIISMYLRLLSVDM
jgi:hypothetical protein